MLLFIVYSCESWRQCARVSRAGAGARHRRPREARPGHGGLALPGWGCELRSQHRVRGSWSPLVPRTDHALSPRSLSGDHTLHIVSPWHHGPAGAPPPAPHGPRPAPGAPSVVTALAACYWSQQGPCLSSVCTCVWPCLLSQSRCHLSLVKTISSAVTRSSRYSQCGTNVMVREWVSEINRWNGIWTTAAAMSSVPTWCYVTAANKVLFNLSERMLLLPPSPPPTTIL